MALNVVLPTKWPTVASPRLLVNVLLFFLLLKVAQVLYTGIRVRVKFQQLKRQGMVSTTYYIHKNRNLVLPQNPD